MAKENPSWGYGRHGLSPAPKRKQAISWKDFIRSHNRIVGALKNLGQQLSHQTVGNMEVLVGTDFFTVEWKSLP
jgi:hypothetical protein